MFQRVGLRVRLGLQDGGFGLALRDRNRGVGLRVGLHDLLLGGDLIVAIDGQEIADPQDIGAIMDKHQAGDTIAVTIFRGRKQMTLKLMLGEAKESS